MNGRGQPKAGQAGGGGAPVRKTLPAWPSATLFPRSSLPVAAKHSQEIPPRRPQQRTPGWFFLITAATGQPEIDNNNKPAPRAVRRAPLASAGKVFIDIGSISLQWAREIIFCVVRTPKADGSGRVRPVWGRPAAHRRC